ncbi:stage V sporulation protein AD [Kineothrix sp. MB12-C1]|uniref:stage V sporulation protein AD n=1 Tax=Kineothrix sp. MB12-C1 TaxID=3070215 RepID=UPI0027D2D44C|nr:stage V sporulation protein AD [Kineothrix sp. MB12-C1]WMC91960.1 stage V sporulation protein AD [Kineothrix sp. MB12-C1]
MSKEKSGYAIGKQSIEMKEPVYIRESASVVGTKEGQGPLAELFDMIGQDDMFGCASWEEAESSLQKDAVYLALGKAGMKKEEIRYIFAGDLLGQSIASSFGLASYEMPLIGMYGACSTCGLTLSMGAITVAGGFAEHVVCVTSSHFASAEKEFRFPLGYGNQRPLSASWTVTGSGAFVLSGDKGAKSRAAITGITTGKIMDYGLKDSMNMGACMAPSACDTIYQNLMDFNRRPSDYDKIITGDLGTVGQHALIDLLNKKGIDISGQHMDCGIEIYDAKEQDTHAGGSGCGCSAVTLSAYILKKLEEGVWKRVLFVPTGALLSKTSFNEGQTVPGIAHGVVLETITG